LISKENRELSPLFHVSGVADPVMSGNCFLTETVRDWGQYLGEAPEPAVQYDIIKATATGRPCGGEAFVKKMETLLSRSFLSLPSGRPRIKKSAEEAEVLSRRNEK
jgi:hypothetical protein